MASSYFYSEGNPPDYDFLTNVLDPVSLKSAQSLNFDKRGTYYVRVEKPKIGDTYTVLSDARIEKDGGSSVILNETQISSVRLVQLYFNTNSDYAEYNNSTSQKIVDNSLTGYNPGGDNYSYMDRLVVEPGQAGGTFTPFFFLVVKGGANEGGSGRALVVEGDITGVREKNWGDWLDGSPGGDGTGGGVPGTGDGGDPTDNRLTPEELRATREELAKVQSEIAAREKASGDMYLKLIAARELLALNEQRLDGLSDEQLLIYAENVLEVLQTTGAWAGIYLKYQTAAIVGVTKILKAGKEAVEDTNSKNEYLRETEKGYSQIDDASDALLFNANTYFKILKNAIPEIDAVYTTTQSTRQIVENQGDLNTVHANATVAKNAVNNLTVLKAQLEAALMENRNSIVELQQTENTLIQKTLGASNTTLLDVGQQYNAGGVKLQYSANDASVGGDFVDMVTLSADYQSVVATAGNVMVFGETSQHDRVVIGGSFKDFTISTTDGGVGLVEGARLSLIAQDVERLNFSDLTIAFDDDGMAGIGYRIYQAAFDRTPDYAGLGHWVRQLDSGASLLDVANAFVGSAEFKANYGANPSGSALVSKLYANVLGREGEATGRAFWEGQIAAGMSYAQVLADFSESPENIAGVAPEIAGGIWYI